MSFFCDASIHFSSDILGGSSESKLGVAGDSAGGRLSAVVSHEAYQVIDFAVSYCCSYTLNPW